MLRALVHKSKKSLKATIDCQKLSKCFSQRNDGRDRSLIFLRLPTQSQSAENTSAPKQKLARALHYDLDAHSKLGKNIAMV